MRILVIEQTTSFANAVLDLLKHEGYQTDLLEDPKMTCDYIALEIYDLVILNIISNSSELIRQLRKKHYHLPILALSEQPSTRERIECLNAGADYYLEKGKEPKELLACIYALLRRTGTQFEQLQFGNTTLDLCSAVLQCGQETVQLTAKEYDMMRLLMQNPSFQLSKEVLLSYVWGYDSNATENNVEVYIRLLRKKLAKIHSDITIVNIRKLGYHLELH